MSDPVQTNAEDSFDSIQTYGFDLTQPNLPETGSNLSVQDTLAANAQFLHQDKAKTILWFVAAGLGVLLLIRVIKKLL